MTALDVIARLLPAALVLGVLLFGLRAWTRRAGGGLLHGVRVRGRAAIGRNTVVAVVEADHRRFLIGAGEQVTLLAELEPEPPDDATTRPPDDATTPPPAPPAASGSHGSGSRHQPRPGNGLLDQLRAMTVRSVERPSHVRPPKN